MSAALVYLDNAATTPLDPRVFEAMRPWFLERHGNAASRQHAAGRAAAEAVEQARAQVADLLGAEARDLVFTSGATESNNLALRGVAAAPAYERLARHVVTARTEHHAVLDPLRALEEREGFEVTRMGVDGEGLVDLDELQAALARGPRLVSLMHANNELGVLHPVAEVGALCREHGVLFHTDATQSAGKLLIDVDQDCIDLLSLSAHKLHGPMGIGALFLRRRRPRVRLQPLFEGGGQERGLRAGTLDVPSIVGFGAAAELCLTEREAEQARVAEQRERLERGLLEGLEDVSRNGSATRRVAGITNLAFSGVEAESLLTRLEGIAASSSAACTSAASQPSHVLRALGVDEQRVASSLRFSLGRFTTSGEIDRAVEEVVRAVTRERGEGPVDRESRN